MTGRQTSAVAWATLRSPLDPEMIKEMAQHLEQRYRTLLVRGLAEEAAYAEVLQELTIPAALIAEIQPAGGEGHGPSHRSRRQQWWRAAQLHSAGPALRRQGVPRASGLHRRSARDARPWRRREDGDLLVVER